MYQFVLLIALLVGSYTDNPAQGVKIDHDTPVVCAWNGQHCYRGPKPHIEGMSKDPAIVGIGRGEQLVP